ncbi:hypothetical protein IRJ14_17385, partial [Isoptericola sp. QY 916]|nr:hypothetical protein [Isoptericola sp. QY 916]
VLDVGAGWGAPSALTGADVPPPAPDDEHTPVPAGPDPAATDEIDEDTHVQEVRA